MEQIVELVIELQESVGWINRLGSYVVVEKKFDGL